MPQLQIQYLQVESLIPFINNARQHSDAQVAQIAASITEFGWGAPILVDGQNDQDFGRHLACRFVGGADAVTWPR